MFGVRLHNLPFSRVGVARALRASVLLLFAIGTSAGCASGDDPQTSNCGRLTDENWVAPEGCECRGPNGETTFVPPGEDEPVAITCEDRRLQMCPSTSGVGCEIPLKSQSWVVPESPELMHLHVDVGGHLHDLCCNAHFSQEGRSGYSVRCNGCGGRDPNGVETCENTTFVGGLLDKPQNPGAPCAAEWQYAVQAYPFQDVFWWTQVDTSTRWTPAQVEVRNLGGTPAPYTTPDADNRPLFGRALAPSDANPIDQRAPTGTFLGGPLLHTPLDPVVGALGLNAEQISSFCQSETAWFIDERNGWICQ